MEPGAELPDSPAQLTALLTTLPGFAFVTMPPPKRSRRRRYIPVAVASLVAIFLFYGVMDENRSIRVDVAQRAQVDDVRIDPEYLPVALIQYPATVTGHTRDGKEVHCTIRSLHDEGNPSCVIPPSPAPIPQRQVRVDASVSSAPPTSAPTPSTPGGNGARVTTKPPVVVPPVTTTTPSVVVPPVTTTTPPVVVPPVTPSDDGDRDRHHRRPREDGHHRQPGDDNQDGRSADDNQDGHHGQPGDDNQDGRSADDNEDSHHGEPAEDDQGDVGHLARPGVMTTEPSVGAQD